MSGWIWIYCVVSVVLTLIVILSWRFTSQVVKKRSAMSPDLMKKKPESNSSIYDSDGERVHFRFGRHDLGGEVGPPAWRINGHAKEIGAGSEASQAIGRAEAV